MPVNYPSRLSAENDEIRLITILPKSPNSELIECNLETVSLLEKTEEYKNFVQTYSNPIRVRLLLSRWFQARSSVLDNNAEAIAQAPTVPALSNEKILPKYPEAKVHRFSWGDFAALSYTWGDQNCKRKAIINGEVVEITQNLEDVLKQLRENGQFGSLFKIWIDQLSINQNDDVERTAQVSKMREIYSWAWSVVAWLGYEKEDSAKAIRFMDSIADYSDKRIIALRDTLAANPRHVELGTWLGLNCLSNRAYWFRLWIVQELALGASGVVLMCGKDTIDWERFAAGRDKFDALWQVKNHCIKIDRMALNASDKRAWGGANGMHHIGKELWRLSKIEKQGEEPASLGVLLEVANFSQCYDERDKVFGMLGVMDPKIASHISPDYTLEPRHVFVKTAKAYIAEHQNLEILREGNPWGKSETPSWAPDWSWTGRLRDNKIPSPGFTADGGKSFYVDFPDENLLTCHAVLLDKIGALGAQGSGMLNFLGDTVTPSHTHESPYGNKDAIAAALQDLLLADRSRSTRTERAVLHLPKNTQIATDRFKQLGWTRLALDGAYYSRWSRWRDANKNFQLAGRPFDEYFYESIPNDAHVEDYEAAWSAWVRTSLGRRIAVSKRGYMAWVPDNRNDSTDHQTRVGDYLAIIMGCSTPIVLRPCDGKYHVVGEGYIQGFMNGEISDAICTGRVEVQAITLQ